MSAIILDGEAVAGRVLAEVADRVERLRGEGISVGLGTVLVGDDAPSRRYVEMKHEDCAKVGMLSVGEHLPETATQVEVEEAIGRFNADPLVNAFLVQIPLPDGLDEERALLAVDSTKDVDGLHPTNLGRLVMGTPGPLPCTPAGIVELLHAYDVPVEGRHAVIIGRGITIGRPLALLLALKRPGCNAAVTVVHTGSTTWPPSCGPATLWSRPPAGPPWSPPTWSSRARPWSGPAPAGRARSWSRTSTPTWPRWPGGSPPGWGASAR